METARDCAGALLRPLTFMGSQTKKVLFTPFMHPARPFRVSNHDRSSRRGVMASSLQELLSKTLDALVVASQLVTLVLEEDGTVVDTEEFFQTLGDNTHLMVLEQGQKWTPIIRKALSEEKRVSTKTSAADLVTETDHVVEALILQELQTRFPSHRPNPREVTPSHPRRQQRPLAEVLGARSRLAPGGLGTPLPSARTVGKGFQPRSLSPVVISDPTVPAAPAPDRDLRAIAFVSGEFLVDSASVKLPEMKETKKYVYYSSFPDGFIVERKALCSPWILPS
ncbi:TPA: cell death-inducing DFFA-like effector a-like [Bos taurus]|nr:TPA: cell death-inducing DFFA-like effector a-like [Bos taurus]